MNNKLIGMEISEFLAMKEIKKGEKEPEICFSEARLIPLFKDELSLTSIFLSSLRLIKEFQKHFLAATDLKSGKIYVFREVDFKFLKTQDTGSRLDGLLLVVKSGKIHDAVFFEMKSKNSQQEAEQITKYCILAEALGVNKIVSISNFVTSNPLQFPLELKISKKINLFHFSWEYVMTVSRMFLHPMKDKIEDDDQKEIMREVLFYLEHKDTGAIEFKDVRKDWKEYFDKLKKNLLKKDDICIKMAAQNFAQFEAHLAHMLSSSTGELVIVNEAKKHRDDYHLKIEDLQLELFKQSTAKTLLKVKNAVSDIEILLNFHSSNMEVSLNVPSHPEKNSKGKISYFLKEIETGKTKNLDIFSLMISNLTIEIVLKGQKENHKFEICEFMKASFKIPEGEIKEFRLSYINKFDKQFESGKFVGEMDKLIINFYTMFVQNFKPIEVKPAKVLENPSLLVTETNITDVAISPGPVIRSSQLEIQKETETQVELNTDPSKLAS